MATPGAGLRIVPGVPAIEGEWTPAKLQSVYDYYGVAPYPTSIAQWMIYWATWGRGAPAYFRERLDHADEFVAAGLIEPWGGADSPAGLELMPGPLALLELPDAPIRSSDGFTDLVTRELGDAPGIHFTIDRSVEQLAGADDGGGSVGRDPGLDDALAGLAAAPSTLDGLQLGDELGALGGLQSHAEGGNKDVSDISGAGDGVSVDIDGGASNIPPDPTTMVNPAPGAIGGHVPIPGPDPTDPNGPPPPIGGTGG